MRKILLGNLHRGLGVGEHATPAELISELLYLTPGDIIPPLSVMNAHFSAGRTTEGVTWEPFEIGEAEWHEVAKELEERASVYVPPPDGVRTSEAWSAWRQRMMTRVPLELRHRLFDFDRRITEQILDTEGVNDEGRLESLRAERLREAREFRQLIRRYLGLPPR